MLHYCSLAPTLTSLRHTTSTQVTVAAEFSGST